MKKGQASVEYIVLVAFMMLVFVGYVAVIQDRAVSIAEEADKKLLQQVVDLIKNELETAAFVEPGYRHKFTLPNTLLGKEYSVTLYAYNQVLDDGRTVTVPEIVVKYDDEVYDATSKISRNVKGTETAIKTGQDNCIVTDDHYVYVNNENFLCT